MPDRLFRRLSVRGPVPVRVVSAVTAAGLVALTAVVLAAGHGLPVSRVELTGGSAWLASPAQGLVTLIDGPAAQVVGSVRSSAAASVVQAGSSAYIVGAGGTVSRVDGATYEVSPPVQFGVTRSSGVQVHPGRAGVYIVDGAGQAAAVVDPVSLRVRERLALAAEPGPGQSVVDAAGRLWVVDRGGVARFDGSGKHVRPDAGGPDARLLLVAGRATVVDLARARVATLTEGSGPLAWSCLDVPTGRPPVLLGLGSLGRVVAVAPSTGALVLAGVGQDECGRSVPVGGRGDDYGPLVESDGFVLVPSRSRGRTVVVDIAARRVVADLPVTQPGHRLELVPKDGLVFYNDLDGDRAGVLQFDGRLWTVGRPLRKYHRADSGILVPATGPVRPQPERPDAKQPDPTKPDQDPSDPDRPDTGANPPQPGTSPGPTAPVDGPPVPQPPSGPPGSSNPPPGDGLVQLTVRVAGPGRVTAARPAPSNTAAGTVCAADATCGWQYPAGTTVTLQIPNAPEAKVLLSGVTGCDSTTSTGTDTECVLTLAAAATVQATFVRDTTPDPVTLTVTRAGGGTGVLTATAAGQPAETCDPTCTLQVQPGTSVDLDATPASGSFLADWGAAGCATTTATCTVQVATDRAVTVAFEPLVDLTVTVTGAGSGTVAGAGLACSGRTCSGSYQPGTAVDLTAAPSAGSAFTGWSGCTPTGALTCTVTVNAGTTVDAGFRVLDQSPPLPTLTGLGQTVTIGSGGRTANVDGINTDVTVTASATDPDGPVTQIEIWASLDWICIERGGNIVPGREEDRLRTNAASGSVSYTFSGGGILCSGSVPRVTFHLHARAVSEGGTSAFTDLLTVRFQ